MHAWNMTGWNWLWMLAMMAFVVALMAVFAFILFRGAGETPLSQGGNTPYGILRRRLAEGEIDEDEYRRLLGVLRSSPNALDQGNGLPENPNL